MVDVHNEAVDIAYLELSTPLYRHAATQLPPRPSPPVDVGISISIRDVVHNPRRRRAVGASISRYGSSPAPAGTPISSSNSSMAIISCRYRVREGI